MDNKTEELNYNKVLVANSYISKGRYTDSYKLISKIENVSTTSREFKISKG